MIEEGKYPKGVPGPPIGFITVKYNGRVRCNANAACKFSKSCRIDIITDCLVIEIPPPIDMDCSGNVTSIVKQHIFVALDDTHVRIGKMRSDPLRGYQCFRVSVFGVGHNCRNYTMSDTTQQNSICP